MEPSFCPRCGTPRQASERFCTGCGLDLSAREQPQPVERPVPTARAMAARAPTVSALDVEAVSAELRPAEAPPAQAPPVAAPAGPPPAAPSMPTPRSGALPWLVAGAAAVVAMGALVVAIVAGGGRAFPHEFPESEAPVAGSPVAGAPEPGGGPISVEGITLTIISVTQPESYVDEFDNSRYRPGPGDALLVVEGVIDGPVDPVQDWEVSAADETGRVETPGITVTTSAPGAQGEVTWVFGVSATSSLFTLSLPGGQTVDLAPLLTP